MTKNKICSILLLLLTLTSCITTKHHFAPNLSPTITKKTIEELPSPFTPLSHKELSQDWGKELRIGKQFAKRLELYRAITSFQRALFLMPKRETLIERQKEIYYSIAFCYYLGKKYKQVIDTFENTPLRKVTSSFPTFEALLVILYSSYDAIGDDEKAEKIQEAIKEGAPNLNYKLELYDAISKGNIEEATTLVKKKTEYKPIVNLLNEYESKKKSTAKASTLNAIFPGAGYWYVGQKSSALTSFIMNGLFTWAAIEFFNRNFIAAGFIATSFELGWYLGAVNGAGIAANEYNERLYEKYADKGLKEEKLYPIFQIRYGF